MGRRTSIVRRVAAIGVLMVAGGGALIVSALTAGSASASPGTITLTPGPTTGYTSGESVTVGITGLLASAQVFLSECSLAAGQPTVLLQGQNLPVSCTAPVNAGETNKSGKLKAPFSMTIQTGTTGPPAAALDTDGNQSAADAANYPCPQFVGQSGGCEIFAFDSSGGTASESFTFASSVPVPTSTVPSTTTTTVPCIPQAATASAAGATVTVTPATCLKNGSVVAVTGSGFVPGDPGGITECSTAPGQPTISLVGNAIQVSCSSPVAGLQTVSPSGTISANFTVAEGTVGPPVSGKDSAGNDASADAQKYSCPSDVATGSGCEIGFGDSPTQNVDVLITFQPNSGGNTTGAKAGTSGPGTATSANGSSSSGGSAAAKTTSTSSTALAFTGTGDGMRWMGAIGALLVVLGALSLALSRQTHVMVRSFPSQGRVGKE